MLIMKAFGRTALWQIKRQKFVGIWIEVVPRTCEAPVEVSRVGVDISSYSIECTLRIRGRVSINEAMNKIGDAPW